MIRNPKVFRNDTGEIFTLYIWHAVEGGSRLLKVRGDRLSESVMKQAA